jgi:hypothetical protein
MSTRLDNYVNNYNIVIVEQNYTSVLPQVCESIIRLRKDYFGAAMCSMELFITIIEWLDP